MFGKVSSGNFCLLCNIMPCMNWHVVCWYFRILSYVIEWHKRTVVQDPPDATGDSIFQLHPWLTLSTHNPLHTWLRGCFKNGEPFWYELENDRGSPKTYFNPHFSSKCTDNGSNRCLPADTHKLLVFSCNLWKTWGRILDMKRQSIPMSLPSRHFNLISGMSCLLFPGVSSGVSDILHIRSH